MDLSRFSHHLVLIFPPIGSPWEYFVIKVLNVAHCEVSQSMVENVLR